jgi:hypothetical protein
MFPFDACYWIALRKKLDWAQVEPIAGRVAQPVTSGVADERDITDSEIPKRNFEQPSSEWILRCRSIASGCGCYFLCTLAMLLAPPTRNFV